MVDSTGMFIELAILISPHYYGDVVAATCSLPRLQLSQFHDVDENELVVLLLSDLQLHPGPAGAGGTHTYRTCGLQHPP